MRLVAAEMQRFRSRRTVVVLLLVGLIAACLLVGKTAWDTRPLSHGDRHEAAAQAALAATRPALKRTIRQCERRPTEYLGTSAVAADCAYAMQPKPQAYYPRATLSLPRVLDGEGVPRSGVSLALLVAGLLLVCGSVYAGADWSSRAITNQVAFEPRRVRLWLAKALAVVVVSAVAATVLIAGFWAALSGIASSRGIEVSGADLGEVTAFTWRAIALAAGAALGGFAVTMLVRHTAVTLVLVLVYVVGAEIAISLLPVSGAGRFALGNNVLGWLLPHHTYVDASIHCRLGEACSSTQSLSHLEAGGFLGVLVLLAAAASLLVFRRQDV